MIVGSVFIRKDCDTTILVEQVDEDRVIFRYVVIDSARLLGKRDWAFLVRLTDVGLWERVV